MKNIRYYVYFFIDIIKKSPIRKHINDIRKIREKKDNLPELDKILKYAIGEIPYYSHIKNCNLNNFPVMNKSIINENINLLRNKKYPDEVCHITSTSGSTGVPFLTYLDPNKRKRTIGDLMVLFSDFGFYTGDRYVFIRSWVEHYNSSKFLQFKQNFIPIDVNTFDNKRKEELRQRLKDDRKIKAIVSYSSAMTDFVSYLEEKKDNSSMFNVKAIFCSSDILTDEAKDRIEKMFGCTVVNRYSNEENGIMANTAKKSSIFNVNISSYYFELLDLEKDEPVPAGKIGRIVITDLFNRAMPLIRYDTGDLGISTDYGSNVKTLTTLVGRIADSIKTENGILISAATLSTYMQEYKYLKKYQLVCTEENKLILRVVTEKNEFLELESVLYNIFGKNRKIKIERVDDIACEANGKYKQIINKYKG